MSNLISKNGELAGAVKVTKNGYSLEKDALISLINTSKKEYNVAVAAQINKTNATIQNTKARIKAIDAEISKLYEKITAEMRASSIQTYAEKELEEKEYTKKRLNK